MRVNFNSVAEGPFPDLSGDPVDPLSENQCNAEIVLRNWVRAATWGLPGAVVADMLEKESIKLRDGDS